MQMGFTGVMGLNESIRFIRIPWVMCNGGCGWGGFVVVVGGGGVYALHFV